MLDNGEIRNKATGLCLTTASGNNRAAIKVAPCTGAKGQHWTLRPTKNDYFGIVTEFNNNKCVDHMGHQAPKGASTIIWSCGLSDVDNMQYKWI